MASAALLFLTLTDFRSYERARLETSGRSVYLFGQNGAGKTNLLEAISLLTPGKGLRGASLGEVGRRLPGEALGRAWAVAAEVESGLDAPVRIGTGFEHGGANRRTVRLDGETVSPGRLADHVRPIWLTPAQDRLFLEAASERRRFFDRLVFAGEPSHAANANAIGGDILEARWATADTAPAGHRAARSAARPAWWPLAARRRIRHRVRAGDNGQHPARAGRSCSAVLAAASAASA